MNGISNIIEDGKFTIDGAKGTFAGSFRVEILATRPSNQSTIDPETGDKISLREQYLPARYNAESELTANIVAGQPNHLDFNLVSQ